MCYNESINNNKTFFIVLVLVIIFGFFVYFFYFKAETKTKVVETSLFEEDRQCYTYSHEATDAEPYSVNEFIDIDIKGVSVLGIKTGTQNGPDMTNGYNGTLTGIVDGDMINVVFVYTIEGSCGQEKEIYKVRGDKAGIEKLRYPLIESEGMLVPDITKEFKTLFYARVGCTASN